MGVKIGTDISTVTSMTMSPHFEPEPFEKDVVRDVVANTSVVAYGDRTLDFIKSSQYSL
jgi:hypothetical protein